MDFNSAYRQLNTAQKEAVDTIDGPLLVVAGPGTGKTQLLSARVANILQKTDTLPHNVLCLTFTESGAANMRERLNQFIGPEAYDVTISTYHGFGSDVLRRASDYFDDRLDTPIDNLRKHQIVESIVSELSFRDPLKQARYHLRDLISTISEVKRALLTPADLRKLAAENEQFITGVSNDISSIFLGLKRMPSKIDKALPYFLQTLSAIEPKLPLEPVMPRFGSLASVAHSELQTAIEEATSSESTKPLTAWKDRWLVKNSQNQFILGGDIESRRIKSLASVLETYQAALSTGGFYDFDDMILRAIDTLENNDDLRFTLQEQYLYILLDEYQDTNAAQSRLVQLLTDNPVSEGRPNVMAVGDDDQAIYAFQGAQYSNMLDFYQHYRDTKLVSLSENYRSHTDILSMASSVANQIDERLFRQFDGASKDLIASNPGLSSAHIERREFKSQIAENTYVAAKVKELVNQGVPASEIAVLTPKHQLLESFVPYAAAEDLPVYYEKRENILESTTVRQLIAMSRLVLMLSDNDYRADSLWPEVLSYDFFAIPISTIWQLGWQVSDHNRLNRENPTTWARQMLESSDKELRQAATLFLALAARAKGEPFELILDYLIGLKDVPTHEPDDTKVTSPLLEHLKSLPDQAYYESLSNLTVLRSRMREYQMGQDDVATLADLIALTDAYQSAGEHMLNTSPYHQATEAVNLMTVFKAKGLEFSHVFLLSVDDSTWGGSGTGTSNRLTLPKNLTPIRHGGANEDERLRLLFVALTRARSALYLTNSASSYSGKTTKRLKYLDEREHEDGSILSRTIPASQNQLVIVDDSEAPPIQSLVTDWQSRHVGQHLQADLKHLLLERLKNYQLSPTDLNSFLNIKYGGPQAFLVENLLSFRGAPSIDATFGNIVHSTLNWIQKYVSKHGNLPAIDEAAEQLKNRTDSLKILTDEKGRLQERGEAMLETYLAERGSIFNASDKAEISFKYDNIHLGNAHLTGTIDRLEIDEKAKTITIVDFKTGTPSSEKAYWYGRQLHFYKLLLERSRHYKNYTVTSGRLEYVEPDMSGQLPPAKTIALKDVEADNLRSLVGVVWSKIQALDFPDTSHYPASLAGSKQFESELLGPDS